MDAIITNEIITGTIVNDEVIGEVTNEVIEASIEGDSTTYVYSAPKLEMPFTFEDLLAGPLEIGNAFPSLRISQVVVIIEEAFDEGTLVIGDDDGHGRLMTANQNNLMLENTYVNEPEYYKYSTDKQIKAWLETGTPTQGSGTILIIYS